MEPHISVRTYLIIGVLLVLLAILTVALSFVPAPRGWPSMHFVVGLLIALTKATLVVLFFMHALISPRLTWIVIAVAIFWMMILLFLTLNDYATRGLVPYTPGH